MLRLLSVLGLITFMWPTEGRAQLITNQYFVHAIYLSPLDRAYDSAYEAEIQSALFTLQSWFSVQTGGSTFKLTADPVQWFQTTHSESWYRSGSAFPADSLYYFSTALGDGFKLSGGSFYDSNDIWLYYLDADPTAGQVFGGTSSVALLPANDLRGLDGQPLVPINSGDTSYNPGVNRWIGGLGHELGHAFGLDHPLGSPGGADDTALMWSGYYNFPNTYLRDSDIAMLASSSFFTQSIPEPQVAPLFAMAFLLLGGKCLRGTRRDSRTACSPV